MRPAGSEDNGAHNIRHQPTESDKVGGESGVLARHAEWDGRGRPSLHQLGVIGVYNFRAISD